MFGLYWLLQELSEHLQLELILSFPADEVFVEVNQDLNIEQVTEGHGPYR